MLTILKLLRSFYGVLTFSLLPLSVWASSAMHLIVPYPAGGSIDIVARTIQGTLSTALNGQSVVIENKPGAASQVASHYVTRAAKDGNTVLLSFDNHVLNRLLKKDLPYDTVNDFTPITLSVRFPLILITRINNPSNTVSDVIHQAQQAPLTFASTGVGSLNHLTPIEFHRQAGIHLDHIPYPGGAQALESVIKGEVDYAWLSYAAVNAQLSAGKVKPIAIASEQRLAQLPNTPTMIESGFQGFTSYSWSGVFAPAGIGDARQQTLVHAFIHALNQPSVRQKLEEHGFEVIAGDPKQLEEWLNTEYLRWKKVIDINQLRINP